MNRLFIFYIFGGICLLNLPECNSVYAQKLSENQLQDSIRILKNDLQKVNAYLHYAQELWSDNLDFSKKMAEIALDLAKKNAYVEEEIKANIILGIIYNYIEPVRAFLFFTQAQKLAQKNKKYALWISALEQQAHYHIRWLQYEEASKCISEAIQLISQHKLGIEYPYQTMAMILAKQGKSQTAIDYYQKAITQKQKNKEKNYPVF